MQIYFVLVHVFFPKRLLAFSPFLSERAAGRKHHFRRRSVCLLAGGSWPAYHLSLKTRVQSIGSPRLVSPLLLGETLEMTIHKEIVYAEPEHEPRILGGFVVVIGG